MIQFDKTRWFYGIWFCENPIRNFMAALSRDVNENDVWTFEYRFRYFVDDKIFDSEDKKSWYVAKIRATTLQSVTEKTHELVRMVANARFEARIDFILLECVGDDKKVLRELEKKPWTNMEQREIY